MRKKYISVFIVCLFFFIGSVVGLFGYQDSFMTDLSDTDSLFGTEPLIPILPSLPYRGEFRASYDRLGMVNIRVSTGGRINTNSVIFRLRQKGSQDWLVENTYVTDRFIDGERYPFGFPILPQSKGKTYEYELSAVDGSSENTIALVSGPYAFQKEYVYSKALIFSDKRITLWFLKEKAKEMFGSAVHMGYWVMCLLPILFMTNLYFAAFFLMILLFGFLPMHIHSNMILWIGFSILFASLYRKKYALPFSLSLCVLFVFILAYAFQGYAPAAKLATILPVLFVAGGITTFISLTQ